MRFNPDFRPKTYFEIPDDPKAMLLHNVQGQKRRDILKEAIDRDDDIEEWLLVDKLSPAELCLWERLHPENMGGEYLPTLAMNEVEIARISMNSTTGDVISVYAKQYPKIIHYRIVDEYNNDIIQPFHIKKKPLTFYELVTLIDKSYMDGYPQWPGMYTQPNLANIECNFDRILEAISKQIEAEDSDVDDFDSEESGSIWGLNMCIESPFYPKLQDYYFEFADDVFNHFFLAHKKLCGKVMLMNHNFDIDHKYKREGPQWEENRRIVEKLDEELTKGLYNYCDKKRNKLFGIK